MLLSRRYYQCSKWFVFKYFCLVRYSIKSVKLGRKKNNLQMAFEWNIFVRQNPRSARERNNLTKTGFFAVIYSLKESCFNHNFWGLEKANNLYSCLSSWKYLYFILWLMLFDTNKTDWKKVWNFTLYEKTGLYYLKFAHTICIK